MQNVKTLQSKTKPSPNNRHRDHKPSKKRIATKTELQPKKAKPERTFCCRFQAIKTVGFQGQKISPQRPTYCPKLVPENPPRTKKTKKDRSLEKRGQSPEKNAPQKTHTAGASTGYGFNPRNPQRRQDRMPIYHSVPISTPTCLSTPQECSQCRANSGTWTSVWLAVPQPRRTRQVSKAIPARAPCS